MMFSDGRFPSPEDLRIQRRVYNTAIGQLEKELSRIEAKIDRYRRDHMAMQSRTRARVTTSNARLSNACAERDDIQAALTFARRQLDVIKRAGSGIRGVRVDMIVIDDPMARPDHEVPSSTDQGAPK